MNAPTVDHLQALSLYWQVSRSFYGPPVKGKGKGKGKGKPLTVEQAFKKLNQGIALTHPGKPVFWKLTGLMSEIIHNQNEGDEVSAIND